MHAPLRFGAPRPSQRTAHEDPHGAFVLPDGRVVHATGKLALRVFPGMVGQNVLEIFHDTPHLVEIWTYALAGRPFAGGTDWGGVGWYLELSPVWAEGKLLGVHLFALPVVPKEPAAEAPEHPEPVQVWTAAGDDPSFGVVSGDQFVRRRGRRCLTLIRTVSEAVFEEYRRENPDLVHLTADWPTPEPSPAGPTLQLVR
jgi:hypothetical protein